MRFMRVAVLLLLAFHWHASANEMDNFKEWSFQQAEMRELAFCRRVYKCLGIERQYDTPAGEVVYQYGPDVQLKFTSATKDRSDDGLRIGNVKTFKKPEPDWDIEVVVDDYL